MSAQQQARSVEWHQQWSMFSNDGLFLFQDWIAPATMETFRDKDVLECGCGGGYHTSLVAPLAKSLTSVDLNTTDIARERNRDFANVTFVEADLASMDLGRQFDVVFCVGVIHHTDDPTRTFETIYRHVKPGGTLIIYGYAAEGNWPMRLIVEPSRRLIFRHLSRRAVLFVSAVLTAMMYPVVHTVYRLPQAKGLPYYDFFFNFRRLSWRRNLLDSFDKLNAPQTQFLTRQVCESWMSPSRFRADSISIRHYRKVCWGLVGVKA